MTKVSLAIKNNDDDIASDPNTFTSFTNQLHIGEYDFGDFDQEATTSYEAHECWRLVFSMGLRGTSSMCALRKV